MEWRVVKARRLIGSKTEVSVGDVVVQVEPPEEGILTVKTQQGEVGPLPLESRVRAAHNKASALSLLLQRAAGERRAVMDAAWAEYGGGVRYILWHV